MNNKCVYFMRPIGKRGPIKIGCSIRPAKRLRDVEIWSPDLLEIVATAPGDHAHERSLHGLFAEQRRHGEWFNWSKRLGDLIDHVIANGTLPPLAVPSGPKEWKEFRSKQSGKMPRRDPVSHQAKYRISKKVRAAEMRAFGFDSHDHVRPEEVQAILESYQGFGSPLPTAAQLELLDDYVVRLSALPAAPRHYRAWLRWYRPTTTPESPRTDRSHDVGRAA
jgi:hypothetical protein